MCRPSTPWQDRSSLPHPLRCTRSRVRARTNSPTYKLGGGTGTRPDGLDTSTQSLVEKRAAWHARSLSDGDCLLGRCSARIVWLVREEEDGQYQQSCLPRRRAGWPGPGLCLTNISCYIKSPTICRLLVEPAGCLPSGTIISHRSRRNILLVNALSRERARLGARLSTP